MQYAIEGSGETTILYLRHHLAFADRRAFLEAIPQFLPAGTARLVIDLHDLRFLDSAGLGMLLSLKDVADRQSVSIVLRGPTGGVRQLLKLAKFETVFTVEDTA